VKAKVFDAGGTELAPEFVVNTTGANASSYQYQPSVAAIAPSAGPGGLPGGGFVVAFRDDSSGSGEIRARVFDQSGAAVSVGGSTDDFMVNTTAGGTQEIPSVAGTADGGFVIAWADSSGQDGSGWGIAAQRYNGAGDPQGDEFVVNEVVNSTQYDPAVIGLDDGRFVVTWTNRSTPAPGSGYDVFAQVYAADGARLDGEMRVNDAVALTQYQSAAAALPGGNFVVVYSSYNQDGPPNTYGVFQQVLGDPADFTPGAALVAQGAPLSASFDEADVNAGLQRLDIDKTIALGDPDATDLDGGRLTLAVAETFNNIEQFAAPDGVAQDRLGLLSGDVGNGDVQIGGTGTGLVGETVSVDGVAVGTIASDGRDGQPFAIDLGALSTVEAVEALLGNLAYANISDSPAPMRRLTLDLTNGDQQSIDTLFIDVAVTPDPDSTLIGDDERRVNAHTESTQGLLSSDGIDGSAQGGPESAELVGGGLVVVWTSYNQDRSFTYGVFGQRYDAAGRPVGPEFQINVNEASTQQDATVAATNDGGFIVVWEDHSGIQDGSSWAIVGRAFDAMGAPKGDEFLVNETASSSQQHPRVARLPDGDVLVVWQDDGGADGSSGGVFAQRLDQDGNLVNFDGTVTPFTVPASLAADYQLNGSAADALGGPAMTLPDPADLGATTYDFDLSSYVFGVSDGPSIANVLASGETYSIEMRFSVDSPNQSWVKILDFKDQTNDTGLYLRSGQLNLWNATGSVGPVLQPGEMVTFVLTRDGATDRVTGYLDGREVFSFTDSGDLAVLSGPDEIIHLLIDDGNPGESSSGEIDYVRMYDAALNEAEIRGLFPNVRTDERLVNTTTAGAQVSPDVAALAADADLPTGGSVVVWRGPDASQNGVYGQIYDINGVAQGGEFQINTTTDGQQFDPAVIGLTGGGFVVVWTDDAADGNSWGVFGQVFDNAGMASGAGVPRQHRYGEFATRRRGHGAQRWRFRRHLERSVGPGRLRLGRVRPAFRRERRADRRRVPGQPGVQLDPVRRGGGELRRRLRRRLRRGDQRGLGRWKQHRRFPADLRADAAGRHLADHRRFRAHGDALRRRRDHGRARARRRRRLRRPRQRQSGRRPGRGVLHHGEQRLRPALHRGDRAGDDHRGRRGRRGRRRRQRERDPGRNHRCDRHGRGRRGAGRAPQRGRRPGGGEDASGAYRLRVDRQRGECPEHPARHRLPRDRRGGRAVRARLDLCLDRDRRVEPVRPRDHGLGAFGKRAGARGRPGSRERADRGADRDRCGYRFRRFRRNELRERLRAARREQFVERQPAALGAQ
jgi:hypothetical protein